jgi:hypothetical protein
MNGVHDLGILATQSNPVSQAIKNNLVFFAKK